MTVSLIVPVCEDPGVSTRTLRSAAAAAPEDFIAVVDGGDDEMVQVAREAGARVFATPSRRGPAVARNIGARQAEGDILLFVDADVMVPPEIVRRVEQILGDEPALDAVIGSYDATPAARGLVSQFRNLLHHWVHQRSNPEASTFWGACGAIRREAFEEVGGFDEAYAHPSIEDIAFGYRLIRQGRRIRLEHSLQVTHLKRWTLGSMVRTDLFRRAMPWTELLLEGGPFINDLNLAYRDRASVVVAALALLGLAGWPLFAPAVLVGGLLLILLLILNAPLYRFLLKRRGPFFTLGAIPLHWLHLLCCGVGFGIALIRFLARRVRRPRARASTIVDREAASTRAR
jgi:glycosyltransferase involved in cell wall biosynthesis